MENKNRIEESLAEMLLKEDGIVDELRNVKSEVVKLNLQTTENTRATIKLAERIEQIVDHEKRITKLESKVFK